LSSIFFLASRISKATIALAELDKIESGTKETIEASIEKKQNTEDDAKMKELLDEIIAKYF
jgi:hypothetical protein